MFEGVIYISGTSRSGSTLLDLLLGGHQDITSLGEVHHLGAYLDKPGYGYYACSAHPKPLTCLCGQSVVMCSFWSKVATQLNCNLIELQLDPTYRHGNLLKLILNKINRKIFIQYFPYLFLIPAIQKIAGFPEIAHNYFKLYQAASQVASSKYVVDSSKLPYRFQYLHTCNPTKVKILLLCREPKFVVASMIKRGETIPNAIDEWNNAVKRMELFSSNIPQQNILRIRYEDLCINTECELEKICAFLKLPFLFSSILYETDSRHHIGGSPSKFRGARKILLDDTYQKVLSHDDMKNINERTQKYREIIGY